MLKKYNCLKRFLSVALIISMVFNSVTFANFFQNDTKYVFAPELEIDDSFIDDGMFYMPHDCLEVNENGDVKKYVVKIKRKGAADTSEKVKLSMLDISGRYDRDYKIKVINKGLFIENVQNINDSKSIDEYMSTNGYEEYNTTDAIVDGLLTDEDIMTDDEIANFNVSDDDKLGLMNDASSVLEEINRSDDGEEVDDIDLATASVSRYIEEDIEDVEEEENIENIEDNEEGSASGKQSSGLFSTYEESVRPYEENISTDEENVRPNIEIATKSDAFFGVEDEVIEGEKYLDLRIASISDIEYSDEKVQFDIKKSTMSIVEGFEMATGLKNDRKKVKPNRNLNTFGVSPNSVNDISYMREGVEAVEESLKSAYVILEFKEGQSEKLIEVSILNDNKYRGDRQVGFNLSEIDGSSVSGMYSSMTLIMHDDEEEEPTYINFNKSIYEPENGYIEVEIERSGELSNVATCMLDSEDITAKSSRDYSQVHTQIVFAYGVTKRRIKIPVVSYFVSKESSFKLKLQLATGALIGDKNEAICIIKNTDKSFKYAIKNNNDLKYGNTDLDKKAEGLTYGASGKDYEMDSVIVGKELDLEKKVYKITKKNANSNSSNMFINGGKGIKLYLENHDFLGETACFYFSIQPPKDYSHYELCGMQIKWSVDSSNSRVEIQNYEPSSKQWKSVFDKKGESWRDKTENFFFDNGTMSHLWFCLYRYDGLWRTSPTLTIDYIKPIYKMYKINLQAAKVPELVNENGEKTSAHKFAKYAITSIDAAKSDGTGIGWYGKTVTVKLDNYVNNPFYIKSLYYKNNDYEIRLATNNDQNATTLSFEMNESFFNRVGNNFKTINRPGGGKAGEFNIYAELGTKESVINIVKDKRIDVEIWYERPSSSTETANVYKYNIGDVLHFNVNVKTEYEETFQCDGLNVYRVKPYSAEWITIRRPVSGEDYFPLDSEYSEIRVVPVLTQKNNAVVVKVKKEDVSSFDTTYGLFANTQSFEKDGYIEYYIERDSSKICGRYFDIKAKCKNNDYVPVWYEANKSNIKIAQNTFYFLGSEVQTDNVITLTAEKADDVEYSVVGTSYYEEIPIGGKVVDKYWQVAPYVAIIIDDMHYAYSDAKGNFATFPGKSKSGYYNQLKIVSNGESKYIKVKLNKDKKVTKEYTIEYETKTEKITKETYEVQASEVLISNIQRNHPYVTAVKSLNVSGSSFSAVYINDENTQLVASVQAKKPDGTDFTYSFVDENGEIQNISESVKRIEFVVVDKSDHSIKKIIEATGNSDKTEWTANYKFEKGHYAEYMSGDKLYVRVVTDKKVGDGKGSDISGSGRASIPIFNETTYQSISTSYPFVEAADREPYIVGINFGADKEGALSIPVIGAMSTGLNAMGMAFTIKPEGEKIRIGVGKKFKGKGNRYDGNGKKVSDTGSTVSLSNFSEGIEDMKNLINNSGTKRLKTMTLGIPTWTIEPTIGVSFDFMLYHDPKATVKDRYEFVGGSGYFGCVIDLRYTFYFLVYGFPCFVGGQVMITLVAEFGLAVDKNKHISFNDPDQGFLDGLIENSHFDFLFRATLDGSAYVGGGIAGTLGVRGGFQLLLKFIYNPSVKQKYDNVRPVGFSATGNIRIWIDAVLLNFSIPVYKWLNPQNFGYFYDLEQNKNNKNNYGSEILSLNDVEIMPKPRPTEESIFVANESTKDILYGAGYTEESTKTLIQNVYDVSEPQLIKYADDRVLLVYLDDTKNNTNVDRTSIKYMTYDLSEKKWSDPEFISNDNTADFSPTVCDCGDKILVSWASRYEVMQDDKQYKDMLEKMEIYAVFFDKSKGSFGEVDRLTVDNGYDYYPKAVYDKSDDRVYLYYLKNLEIGDIENAEQILDELQPEVNDSYLMYMIYDDPTSTGKKHWVRDYYYDYELKEDMTETEKQEFINTWKGQRFQNLSINIGGDTEIINNPTLTDYVLFYDNIYNVTYDEIENFVRSKGYDSLDDISDSEMEALTREFETEFADKNKKYKGICYVVEKDSNLETKNDTEIFLNLHTMDSSDPITIRLTHNNVSDMMPRIVQAGDETYLLWIENESLIKMVDLDNIIAKATKEDHKNNPIITGSAHIETVDNMILSDKISNFSTFADSNNNLFIVWQQNTSGSFDIDEQGEIEFNTDLYMSGLITSENNNGEKVDTWSNSVQLTNNQKVNDLPAVLDIGGKLLFVNNQYNLKSNEESYEITNSNLQQIIYKPSSSLNVVNINKILCEQNDDGSSTYDIEFVIQNTGQVIAKGYEYSGSIMYGSDELVSISGESDEYVLPGGNTKIGGMSINSDVDIETPLITLSLNETQVKNIEDVKFELNIVEKNIHDEGVNISGNLFDVIEEFKLIDLEDEETIDSHITTEHEGDEFVIKGILINSGYIPAKGNEKIYIIKQDDWDKPIATSDYINLDVNEQTRFAISIPDDILYGNEYGYEDLVVVVKNDNGDVLSEYMVATVNADSPYNFKLNGQTEKIKIKIGESVNLNPTYEPSDRFINASFIYSTSDIEIANVIDNKIIGFNEGTTKLNMSTLEYGGNKTIEVEVVPNSGDNDDKNTPSRSSSGSDGGGSSSGVGPIPNNNIEIKTTNVPYVKNDTAVLDSKQIVWVYDPVDKKFRMNIIIDGLSIPATNGFYSVNEYYEYDINGVKTKMLENHIYCFDEFGNMLTGYVKTIDNKTYLFEYEKTLREGQMIIGWRYINGFWYYFSADGSMLINAITPDGYYVGSDGKWVK